MRGMESRTCHEERQKRTRFVEDGDPRLRSTEFPFAPYIHKNNQPKYHAMLLRAHELAKHNREYVLWFAAVDEPDNPAQITSKPSQLEKKLERLLQVHEQKKQRHSGGQFDL